MGRLSVVQEENSAIATLPLVGSWRSLPVTAVGKWEPIEGGDSAGFFVQFAASPEAVRAALNAAGFSIPVSGRREFGELATTALIRPLPGASGVEFVCGT
jgi:hypothetical protein